MMNVQHHSGGATAAAHADLEPEVVALLRHIPQQERSIQRVNLILATADALFAEVGYDAVTTNQIAAQAALPIGSLYQFFEDKATILQALAVRYRAGLAQLLPDHPQPQASIVAATDQFLNKLFVFGSERWGFTRILLLGSASPETKPAVRAVQDDLVRHLAQVVAPYLSHLRADEQAEVATIAMTAFQALLAHAVTLKYTLAYAEGHAAMTCAFTHTKLMIGAYLERLTTVVQV